MLVLDLSELRDAVGSNPFKTTVGNVLHFFFLETKPPKPDLLGLKAVKTKTEQFKLVDKVFYLYAPEGIGPSRLAAKVEQCLGVPATARNWNTVSKLMTMVEG